MFLYRHVPKHWSYYDELLLLGREVERQGPIPLFNIHNDSFN